MDATRSRSWWALGMVVAALAVGACGDDAGGGSGVGGGAGGGSGVGGGAGGGEGDPDGGPGWTVALDLEPTTYENGVLPVAALVTGDYVGDIVLLLDGAPLGTLSSPYAFDWDTTNVAEGAYTLRAQAGAALSDEYEVVVDRTPPEMTVSPEGGAEATGSTDFVVTFDEPVVIDLGDLALEADDAPILHSKALGGDGVSATLSASLPEAILGKTVSLEAAEGAGVDRAGNASGNFAASWPVPYWVKLGGAIDSNPSGTYGPKNPVLAFDDDDAPCLGYAQFHTDLAQIVAHVMCYRGGDWDEYGTGVVVGQGANDGQYDASLDLEFVASEPAFAAHDVLGPAVVYLWDGDSFELVNAAIPSVASGSGVGPIALEVYEGALHLLAVDRPAIGSPWALYYYRDTGTTWEPRGSYGGPDASGVNHYRTPSLYTDLIGASNVAYFDEDGALHAATFTTSFANLGTYIEAIAGGFGPYSDDAPSIAGYYMVVREQGATGYPQAHALYWNGAAGAWHAFGAGAISTTELDFSVYQTAIAYRYFPSSPVFSFLAPRPLPEGGFANGNDEVVKVRAREDVAFVPVGPNLAARQTSIRFHDIGADQQGRVVVTAVHETAIDSDHYDIHVWRMNY